LPRLPVMRYGVANLGAVSRTVWPADATNATV
jgi:hypothetical protein